MPEWPEMPGSPESVARGVFSDTLARGMPCPGSGSLGLMPAQEWTLELQSQESSLSRLLLSALQAAAKCSHESRRAVHADINTHSSSLMGTWAACRLLGACLMRGAALQEPDRTCREGGGHGGRQGAEGGHQRALCVGGGRLPPRLQQQVLHRLVQLLLGRSWLCLPIMQRSGTALDMMTGLRT